MSGAAVQATVPLYEEGSNFWQKVVEECARYVQAINRAVLLEGISVNNFIELQPGPGIHMRKDGYPSTDVKAFLSFFPWGPVIQCTITGARDANHKFLPEEFEIPIARDLDGETVGIFDEGRSFCPREVACYLTQAFRCCFHSVSLPCV